MKNRTRRRAPTGPTARFRAPSAPLLLGLLCSASLALVMGVTGRPPSSPEAESRGPGVLAPTSPRAEAPLALAGPDRAPMRLTVPDAPLAALADGGDTALDLTALGRPGAAALTPAEEQAILDEIAELEDDIAEWQTKIAEKQVQIADMQQKIIGWTAELAIAEPLLEQAKEELQRLKDEKEILKAEKDALHALWQDVLDAEPSADDIEAHAAWVAEEAAAYQAFLDKKDELDAVKELIELQKALVKELKKAVKKYTKKIAKGEVKIATWTDKILGWQEDIAGADDQIDALEQILSDNEDPGDPDPGGGDPGGGDPGGEPGSGDPGGDPDPGGGGNPSSVIEIPLLVHEALPKNESGFQRNGEVVTFGMPLPEDWDIQEIGGRPALGVAGSSTWQVRSLAHWPSGAVKWALVDARVNVAANGTNTGLQLEEGLGDSGQADVASETIHRIYLDSGPLEVEIRKTAWNLFDRVAVDGVQLVAPGTSPGLLGATAGGGEMIVPAPDTQVTLVENGPARAVVEAVGALQTTTGAHVIDFTCRMQVRAGERDVSVNLTLRNADAAHNQHVVLDGLTLWTRIDPGNDPVARLASHDGAVTLGLGPSDGAWLFQAYSDAPTDGLDGTGTSYKPHIPKIGSEVLADEGYRIGLNQQVLYDNTDKDLYPKHGFADVTGGRGGVTVAIQHMPYQWPAALEVSGAGHAGAGLFTTRNQWDYTFVWRQHESRTALFSFHADEGPDPGLVAKGLDFPVVARAADYGHYDDARVFPYRLLTIAEQNAAYSAMGLAHSVFIKNDALEVTRFLPAHQTGGTNNHANIERRLVGEFLRHGHGGQYLSALDLATYKSEWQILRSDTFEGHLNYGASNPQVPHSTAFDEDDEHRYREGIMWAYFLTGEPRYRDALFDEAENLRSVSIWPHERSMYQTLRAMALVGEFTGDEGLKAEIKERIQYFCLPTLDVNTATSGWGWQAAPGQGSRRYFANSSQNTNEMVPGENFVCRGFISGSLGPLGFYHAARYLGESDPDAQIAAARMRDLSYWTVNELYVYNPVPANRRWTYSYPITLQSLYYLQASVYHPFLLGAAETFKVTGYPIYIERGLEMIESHKATDQGSYSDNMYNIESRLDCMHFLRTYLDWVAAGSPGAS